MTRDSLLQEDHLNLVENLRKDLQKECNTSHGSNFLLLIEATSCRSPK